MSLKSLGEISCSYKIKQDICSLKEALYNLKKQARSNMQMFSSAQTF